MSPSVLNVFDKAYEKTSYGSPKLYSDVFLSAIEANFSAIDTSPPGKLLLELAVASEIGECFYYDLAFSVILLMSYLYLTLAAISLTFFFYSSTFD